MTFSTEWYFCANIRFNEIEKCIANDNDVWHNARVLDCWRSLAVKYVNQNIDTFYLLWKDAAKSVFEFHFDVDLIFMEERQ